MSDYEARKAAYDKKVQEEEQSGRQKEIVVGETSGKVEQDIPGGRELKVKIHEVNDLYIASSENLKKGDVLKITIKANPKLSEEHKPSWDRKIASHADEAYGTLKGTTKAGHDLKLKIDHINVQKVESSVELDRGDSIRIIIEKA